MPRLQYSLKSISAYLILGALPVCAEDITWTARSSQHDMNNPVSWSSGSVPGSGDNAIFDSDLRNINTSPTLDSAPFSVSTFHFPNNASLFDFYANNQTLSFMGVGFTGNRTRSTLHIRNVDNGSFIDNQLSFYGSQGTCGSANISIANRASLSSNQSMNIGDINSHFYSSGAFTLGQGGTIQASNFGKDSSEGSGGNGVANINAGQIRLAQSFTAQDSGTVSVSNYGVFSGANNLSGEAVGTINGCQFLVSGTFQVDDNFSLQVHNTAYDSCNGIGLSCVAQVNASQMSLQSSAAVGNNCKFLVSNYANNTSHTSLASEWLGYLNDQQFVAGSSFHAGDDFSLSVDNIAVDASSGYGGAQVAVINSNSGTTGNQILFAQGGSFGKRANMNVQNSGTYTGANTNIGSNVANMNLGQIAFGDSLAIGSYAFSADDDFVLCASCIGNDSASGVGGDVVGNVSSDQVAFYAPCTVANNAHISITKNGCYTGHASSAFVNVGSAGGSQLNCQSSFQAGDDFSLEISNSGTHKASGAGLNFIGDVIFGQQASFHDSLDIGHNGSICISNCGYDSSNTSIYNQVGSMMGYGKQLLVNGGFTAGDNLHIEITNVGIDQSQGNGGNYVAFINNNTVDGSGSQVHLNAGVEVGESACIMLSNSGIYQGSSPNNVLANLAGQQFYAADDFRAGANFYFSASNSGVDNALGQANNSIGIVGGGAQIDFGGACLLGDHACIHVENSGENNDASGASNLIGYVGGNQISVGGEFSAGSHLSVIACNSSVNAGDVSNSVGYINHSQIVFAQGCNLNDGSLIKASNAGTVGNSQIVFNEGFAIADGKARIQAINNGTVGSFGIDVQGITSGGRAEILLKNSSLNIQTNLPTFTIAGLDGDASSYVQSKPLLIINTDDATSSVFSGCIQDFPSMTSSLLKTGPGTQVLSGNNTFTGSTTIQEGSLIVAGSLGGDVIIEALGNLEGAGTVGGSLVNAGCVIANDSAGTLNVQGDYTNQAGTYEAEVNGRGESYVINASGVAALNGGTVLVSSMEGTYKFKQPYTIVASEVGVLGGYTEALSCALITPTLSQDDKHVYLTLQPNLMGAADTDNQYGTARNLDAIPEPNTKQSLLISSIANLPIKDAQKSLESLSGFQYTQEVWVTEMSTRKFLRHLYDPLRSMWACSSDCSSDAASCRDWSVWLEADRGYAHVHGNNAHKLHVDSYQISGGVQNTVFSCLTLGLAASYEYDHIKCRETKGHRNSQFLAAYGLYKASFAYGLFDIAYGHASSNLQRNICAGDLHYKAVGKPNTNLIAFYGETGFDCRLNSILIQPFLGVQIDANRRSKFKENAKHGWRLSIHNHQWTSSSTRLGVHFYSFNLCNGIDASVDMAWNQRLTTCRNRTKGCFTQFGEVFPIHGNHLERHSFDYAFTLTSSLCTGVRGYVELSGEWWRQANTFDVLCGIEFAW